MEAIKSFFKTQNKHFLLVFILLFAAALRQNTLASSRQRRTQMPRTGYRIYRNARLQHHAAARLVQRRPSAISLTRVTSVLPKFHTYVQVADSSATPANRPVNFTKSHVSSSINPAAIFQKSSLRSSFDHRDMGRKAGRTLGRSPFFLPSSTSWLRRVSPTQTLARRHRLKFHQPLKTNSLHQRLGHKRSRFYPYRLWRLRQKIGKSFAGHRASSIGLAISHELSLNQQSRRYLFFDENNSNQSSSATRLGGNTDVVSTPHIAPTNAVKISSRSPPLHEETRSNSDLLARRNSIKANATTWWKGENVCVEESAGIFRLNKEILKRLTTNESCVENLDDFVCIQTFNIGGHIPVKTTTYFCCLGFEVTHDRQSCQAQDHSGTGESVDLLTVRNVRHTGSHITRSASDDDVFTIFMPHNEAVLKAFNSDDISNDPENNALLFLENHVVANKKILSSQLENNQILTAFSGNPIRINMFPSDLDNIMTANCRLVTAVDETTENAVLHYIDNIIEEVRGSIYDYLVENDKKFSKFLSVMRNAGLDETLRDPSGSYTVLALTNDVFDSFPLSNEPSHCLEVLARNHVIDDVFCTAAIDEKDMTLTSLHGNNLTFRSIGNAIYVNKARVLRSDIMATNGVIYVLNKLLKPLQVSSILDIMNSYSYLSTMVKMFEIAEIKNALGTGNNFTLIVPTNKAFKNMPKQEFVRMTKYIEDLRSVLMFHLVPSVVEAPILKTQQRLETLNPPKDIHVTNYPVKVLMRSKSGRKHYVRKTATSLQCSRVIGSPELKPCNGAVYFVDKVLKPPIGTLLSALMYSKHSNFTILLKAIRRSGLDHIFDGNRVLTAFAPSDIAFARFPPHVTKRLLMNKRQLIRVIKFHLVPGYNCKHKLLQRPYKHRTLLRAKMTSCPKRGSVYFGRKSKRLRAKILQPDIEATNGVVHAIDNLLLPKKFRLF